MALKRKLVGMRFHPTDDELVNHYLRRKHLKVADEEEACVIPEIDIYSHEPPKLNKVYDEISDEKSDGNYCYFFCPRGSNKNGYTKRKTRDGFWKETSEKQVVQDEATEEVMWTKRYFVYHQGPLRSSCKTDWVMHEYCLGSTPEDSDKAAFALCHVKKKKKKNKQVKQRRINAPAKSCSNGARKGSSFPQKLEKPEVKEESILIQVSTESEISTDSEPTKQSVNYKPSSDEQSENNSMANNYDTVYEDYISIIDLFNQEELDQEAIQAALY